MKSEKILISLTNKIISKLPACGPRCIKFTNQAAFLLLFLFPFREHYTHGWDYPQWDFMAFSGILTFLIALNFTFPLSQQFETTIRRLTERGVLFFTNPGREQFVEMLQSSASQSSKIGSLFMGLMMVFAYPMTIRKGLNLNEAFLGYFEIIVVVWGGIIAGSFLGKMIEYGQLYRRLKKHSVQIKVNPEHLDKVCGMKPVGEFYYFQAHILAIPAAYLLFWWVAFPLWPRDYSHWEQAHIWLMGFTIIATLLSFALPVRLFNRYLAAERKNLLNETDSISHKIQQLQVRYEYDSPSSNKSNISDQIKSLTDRYWAIENMSVWPVDIRIRRKFKITNLLLLFTLLGDITNRNVDINNLSAVLKSWLIN